MFHKLIKYIKGIQFKFAKQINEFLSRCKLCKTKLIYVCIDFRKQKINCNDWNIVAFQSFILNLFCAFSTRTLQRNILQKNKVSLQKY